MKPTSIYNNSRLRLFERCQRSYYYNVVMRLAKKSSWREVDRDEGSMLHDVLATWLDPKDPHNRSRTSQVIDDYYDKLLEDADLDIEAEAHEQRREYMHELWAAYLRCYPNETWVVQDVEVSGFTALGDSCYICGVVYPGECIRGERVDVECDHCGARIHYVAGQADVLAIDQAVLKLVDHKTKGGKSPSVSDSYLESFNESRQFTQYMYIFTRIYGRPVSMGIANCIAKLKTIDKRGNPFKRNIEIVRTSTDFELYVADTRALIQDIEHNMAMLDENGVPLPGAHPFRRNPDACHDYGLCQFYALCWPTRRDWWTMPFDCQYDYTQAPVRYVEDFETLIQEERL